MVKCAIVGCGGRAAAHASALEQISAGELVACCDVDENRLNIFGERFGIQRRFTDLLRMMESIRPDVVHIVTPPQLRWAIVETVLRMPPRAILIEKPLATRPEEGRRIFAGCEAKHVQVFVNHQLRFHRPWQRLREVVQSGALGRLCSVRASARGNVLEQGTHLLDLVAFVLGEPEAGWVFAHAEGARGFAESHACPSYTCGVLALPDVHVHFEFGPPAGPSGRESNFWLSFGVEVIGERGRAGGSANGGFWLQEDQGVQREPSDYVAENERAECRLIESVLRCLDDASDHPCNAARSAVSFDWVMAAQASALCRRRVDPAERVSDAAIDALRRELERADEDVHDVA